MKAFKKEPGNAWKRIEIPNTLEAMQKEVGGYIEVVQLTADTAVVCDEEGRLHDKDYCWTIGRIDFVGTILLVGTGEEDFKDVPDSATILTGPMERW